MGALVIVCAGLLAAILLRAAWGDIRARDIPNWIPLSIVLLAPLWWWANGVAPWPALAWQVGAAALVFTLFTAAWMIGLMGGGDVKLLAALALWFAPLPLMRLLTVMALAGGAVTIVTLVAHRMSRRETAPEVPYGVAIAFAGLWSMANHILTTAMR